MSSSIKPQTVIELLGEVLAIFIAIRVIRISGIPEGLLVFFTASWLFYKSSSYERLWDLLAMLKNPARALMVYFSGAVIYYGLAGRGFETLVIAGVGAALVGAALALVLEAYWNIGG